MQSKNGGIMEFILTLIFIIIFVYLFKYLTNVLIFLVFFIFSGASVVISSVTGYGVLVSIIMGLLGATLVFTLLPHSDFGHRFFSKSTSNNKSTTTIEERLNKIEQYLVEISSEEEAKK